MNKKHMQKIIFSAAFVVLFFARTAFAGNWILSADEVSAASRILQTYATTSALVIALITSIIVFRNARKMKGGVFEKVLNNFGFGMVLVLVGFAVDTYPAVAPAVIEGDTGTLSNILFILGYVFMAVAATKLSRAIEG